MKPKSLYLHIPFCVHLCHYCDFTKVFYNEKWAKKYLEVLIYELQTYKIDKCKTIFIGGGTPSSLTYDQLEYLLSHLNKYLDKDYEFSIEVNPETLDFDKISLFKKYGINRVSIGVQTFNETVLKKLGRYHTNKDVKNVVNWLNKVGITNYSFDLIYGLEGTSKDDVKHDLDMALSYNVKHLSLYSLIIEPNTKFFISKVEALNDDELRTIYDFIINYLYDHGFIHYEVSNFAIDEEHFSKHNLTYWQNKEYYGIGLGASGYINGIRYQNTKSLNEYFNYNFVVHKETIDLKNKEFEYIMLNLRTIYGINFEQYNLLFNKNFKDYYKEEINQLKKLNLIEINENSLKVTSHNLYILDSIITEFIKKL